jgi:hypothetical protein
MLAKDLIAIGATGGIMDFEPSYEDYTKLGLTGEQAAGLYAAFLAAQTAAFAKYPGLVFTFDAANLGHHRRPHVPDPRFVDQAALRHHDGHVHEPGGAYAKAHAATCERYGVPKSAIDFGIATMLTPPYAAKSHHRNWNWTAAPFQNFAAFLSAGGFERMSFWRIDIDNGFPANATEPWFWNVASRFLNHEI